MTKRIKLNNRKSISLLPLGDCRISIQRTNVRNSLEGKNFTKALSVAALAGLSFLGAQANAQNNLSYGEVTVVGESRTNVGEGNNISPLLKNRRGAGVRYENTNTLNSNSLTYENVSAPNGENTLSRNFDFRSSSNQISTLSPTERGTLTGAASPILSKNSVINSDGLNVDNMSTLDSIKWENSGTAEKEITYNESTGQATGTIKVNLPNDEVKFYTFTYTNPYTDKENHARLGNITKNLEDEWFYNRTYDGYGAAIYTSSKQNYSVKADFILDASIRTNYAFSGALYNNGGKISSIDGAIIGNYGDAVGGNGYGGAIGNWSGTIDEINADFIGNRLNITQAANAVGGAIYNRGTNSIIGKINGNFIANTVYAYAQNDSGWAGGGAIAMMRGTRIDSIKGHFIANSAEAYDGSVSGGAIYNENTIGEIIGDFVDNHASSTNKDAAAGAVINGGNIRKITGNFNNNYVISNGFCAMGGAIWNNGTIGDIQGSFRNNHAHSTTENNFAVGGAVFTRSDIQFTADNFKSVFSGNYTEDYRGKINNAIFTRINSTTTSPAPTITLNAINNGSFIFDDSIDGGEINGDWTELKRNHQYNLKLKGDSSGKVYFNNDILNANIEHNDVTTYVDGMKYLNHAKGEGINSLTMNSGTLNIGSFNLAPLHFETFGMNGGTINIDKVDVDLANKVMGRISANSYGGSDKGTINVKTMNVLSDGEKEVTPVLFADKSFKHTVKSPVKEAYTKLYRYDVSYDTNGTFGEDGYFVFTRGGNGRNSSDSFNPAVLTDTTAVQAGGQTAMNNVFLYAFEHADIFSQLPSADRFAKINSNKYAIASTDFNSNLKYNSDLNNKGVWVKPYSTFENIKLKNGPKVNTINYGTLVGFDSDFHKLKHGWANVATAYIGYSGSQMDYKGVDASMNSGLIGLTETFYKGNFWTALTATAGAGVAEAHTMYGKDDITMLMAGIGSKTGYNFEFKEGKFIVQPRLFMSYSFVNSFDYTNSAGVRIDSDPMHTVQINPSLRIIGNTKGGWQPYASVGMVWNLLNETHATADGVKLPEMHTKPYVEYGVGLQRTWADKFSAYGQAMLRHGGRNGVALTLGFRWALGRDYSRPQKVQKDSKMSGRQEVKRASKTLSHQNEPATEGNRKVLKQLSPTQRQKLANTTTIVNNIYPQKAHLEHTTRTAIKANVEKL